MNIEILIALLSGYFFGSIPFGLLLTRFAGEGDIRKIGSGNIGATNVLRTGAQISCSSYTYSRCRKRRIWCIYNWVIFT